METKHACTRCLSENIEQKEWVKMNTGQVCGTVNMGQQSPNDFYCPVCEGPTLCKDIPSKYVIDLISPDGIPMEQEGFYKNTQEAVDAFLKWSTRFEAQGYYSSNEGRIPLTRLFSEMEFKLIPR